MKTTVLSTAALAAVLFPCLAQAQAPTVPLFEAFPPEVIRGGFANLEWQVDGADTVSINQGVGGDLPASGTARIPISNEQVLVSGSALWRYLDDGGGSLGDTGSEIVVGDAFYDASNWKHPDFDDSGWKEGNAPLGYSDAPATEILFGPDPDNANNDGSNKFITAYFRHEFALTAEELAALQLVFLDLRRDDGAIVYVNGVEVLRSGLPEGFVDDLTEASATTGGAVETTFFRQILDTSVLVEGENTIAVELHQAAPTSSDTVMALRLTSVTTGLVREQLLGPDTEWKYLDDGGESLGPVGVTSSSIVSGTLFYNANHWKHPDFDDSAWETGRGVFGYDTTGFNENSLIGFGGDPQNKHLTYYFRGEFFIADQAQLDAIATVTANLVRDDGGVVYINGREIGRSNMAQAPSVITSSTRAGSSTGSETADNPLPFNRNVLVVGRNVVAVEVHQGSPTSSDVSFDLSVVAEDAAAVATELLPKQSMWRFLDDGSPLDPSSVVFGNPAYDATSWKHPDFDDDDWGLGFGELGYGDGTGVPQDFTTVLDYRARLNKYPTAYFRTEFDVSLAALADFEDIEVRYRRDDGVIIYLNGTEIVRDNVAAGVIDRDSGALGNAGDDGADFQAAIVPKALLVEGKNIIAVELHQAFPTAGGTLVTSSDTVFDLLLSGVKESDTATFTLSAANGQGTTEEDVTVTLIDPPADGRVFLTTSNVAGLNWDMPEVWSSGSIPEAGVDYVVYPSLANVLRTPAAAAPFFEGESLEIGGRFGILSLAHAGGVADVLHLIMNGGQIWNERGSGDVTGIGLGIFGGRISVLDDLRLQNRGADRTLEIGGNLEGEAAIDILPPNTGTTPSLTAVWFTGDNANYSGTIRAADSVIADTPASLGTGSVEIQDGALFSVSQDFESALVADLSISAGGGIDVTNVIRFDSGRVSIAGNVVPDGVYTASSLGVLGFGGVFNDGGGLVIVGEVSVVDADGDEMDDNWEIDNFGGINVSDGTGDSDGDGSSDLEEFFAGTDPLDASSKLLIVSATRDAVSGSATVVWVGAPGVIYRVQYSDDLLTWTDFNGTFSGIGPHAFTDDGSESVPTPDLVPRRFYRVEVVRF